MNQVKHFLWWHLIKLLEGRLPLPLVHCRTVYMHMEVIVFAYNIIIKVQKHLVARHVQFRNC